MSTLNYATTARTVFTPVGGSTTAGVGGMSNVTSTVVALVHFTVTGNLDLVGLTNSGLTDWYHALSWSNRLTDDDGLTAGLGSATTLAQDTTNWWWVAFDWPTTAAAQRYHWRNHSSGATWVHSTSSVSGGAARAGPGTSGWLRIGYFGDNSAGTVDKALVAIWAGTRFTDTDYGTWTKTSDLWNHALGHPSFLTELNTSTPSDIAGGSTYSSSNSTPAPTLTGADPPSFTFDGIGGGITGSSTASGPGVAGEFHPHLNSRMWL
jgi:hypothetical protein